MSRVAKPLACLAVLLAAGYFAWAFVEGRRRRPPPPALPAAPGLAEAERGALARASDLEAPVLFRQAIGHAATPAVRAELEDLYARRARDAARALEIDVEELRTSHRYEEAVRAAARYASAWTGTEVVARADALVGELRAEEEAQVARRTDEALALLDEGRFDGAREALRTSWQLEAPYAEALAAKGEELERQIRLREHEASRTPPPVVVAGKPPAASAGTPPAPPPLPGAPHADVKRLAEARALLAQARRAFDERRHQPAAKALGDLVGYYGDLRYVSRRRDAIAALGALARHGSSGVSGLFRAAEVKRDGPRIRLRYKFETEEELLDWEELQPVPHPGGGSYRRIADGVRGEGVMAFLLRAFFENDVSVRCVARPRALRSHGLVFAQDGLETRFLLWMVANTFFVEGENYVKERPGHAILMFGKGVNNDVPVDSPEMGFIFRGDSITKPELALGEEAILGFAARENQMSGEILFRGDRGGRSGSTLGDDGKGIERLRPGLVVLDSTVVFRDVLVEGKLHPDFERSRVAALLDAVTKLGEE
jgi:hypothetical protein